MIDEAYEVLTSSEEGWYFNVYNGWDPLRELGGYWFLCKFYKNPAGSGYLVDAAFELDVIYFNDDDPNRGGDDNVPVESHLVGEVETSPFEINMQRGAVLEFNVYNGILSYFARPDSGRYQGLQGETRYSISEVTENVITVQGIQTGKTMRLYRKTDGKTVADAMRDIGELNGAKIRFGDSFDATINSNIVNPSVSRNKRTVTISHDVSKGFEIGESGELEEVIERKDEKFLYSPRLDGSGIDLYEPFTLTGSPISGFAYDSATESYVSNDPWQSIVLKSVEVPLNQFYPGWTWILDEELSSEPFMALWKTAEELFDADEGRVLIAALFGDMLSMLDDPRPGITFFYGTPDGSQQIVQYVVNFTAAPGGNPNEISISFRMDGADAENNKGLLSGVSDAIFAKSPYVMTTDPLAEEWIRFTSKSDSSFHFTTTVF
jgi:hypothetical protein